MLKQAYATPEFRQLSALARPYYDADGGSSWAHIQEVRRRAQKMVRKLYNRSLMPAEYAAILFHDSTKRDMGRDNHGPLGASRAAQVLAAAGLLTPQQRKVVSQAIGMHDDNAKKFPTTEANLLASADANPPDLGWVLNKSYNYAMTHGLRGDDRISHILQNVPRKYGTNGTFNEPSIYKQYYGPRAESYKQSLDKLDFDTAKRIVESYRSHYGIAPDEIRVIHNA